MKFVDAVDYWDAEEVVHLAEGPPGLTTCGGCQQSISSGSNSIPQVWVATAAMS